MSSSSSYSCLIILLISFIFHSALGDPEQPELYHLCNRTRTFNSKYNNSIYQTNLNQLLSILVTQGPEQGFLSDIIGVPPNTVYGLILCRGDVNASICISCLTNANLDIIQGCTNHSKSAIIWYNFCTLTFSDQLLTASTYIHTMSANMWNINNVKDVGQMFQATVANLLKRITKWAVFDSRINTTKMFATGEVNFRPEYPMIYGLVQCTTDLTDSQCEQCLLGEFDPFPKEMQGKIGGRMIGMSCNFRFEIYKFYIGEAMLKVSPPIPASAPSPAPRPLPAEGGEVTQNMTSGNDAKGNKKKTNRRVQVLKIAVPVGAALLLIPLIYKCFIWMQPTRRLQYEYNQEEIRSFESLLFDLFTLQIATAYFSKENKLGEGGYGGVYKGTLPDGRVVAVKKLLGSSLEGFEELKNELVLVAKLKHKNLVVLLGACFQEEKLLVYEYVPNGSLDSILFDPARNEQLNWETRYKIIEGIARGLLYLHEESQLKIIHRDIKASNVLLDESMNPKISDFGIARLFGGDQTRANTSRVVGTFGYMAPEYVMRGQISVKSDIFSFGVLVLEIVTGRKRSGSSNFEHYEDLLSYVWKRWIKGGISEILDPSLGENCPRNEVLRCIQVGLMCVQENPLDRPNISSIILMLNCKSVSLHTPSEPAFLVGMPNVDEITHSKALANKPNPMSKYEVSISEFGPR